MTSICPDLGKGTWTLAWASPSDHFVSPSAPCMHIANVHLRKVKNLDIVTLFKSYHWINHSSSEELYTYAKLHQKLITYWSSSVQKRNADNACPRQVCAPQGHICSSHHLTEECIVSCTAPRWFMFFAGFVFLLLGVWIGIVCIGVAVFNIVGSSVEKIEVPVEKK